MDRIAFPGLYVEFIFYYSIQIYYAWIFIINYKKRDIYGFGDNEILTKFSEAFTKFNCFLIERECFVS